MSRERCECATERSSLVCARSICLPLAVEANALLAQAQDRSERGATEHSDPSNILFRLRKEEFAKGHAQ